MEDVLQIVFISFNSNLLCLLSVYGKLNKWKQYPWITYDLEPMMRKWVGAYFRARAAGVVSHKPYLNNKKICD